MTKVAQESWDSQNKEHVRPDNVNFNTEIIRNFFQDLISSCEDDHPSKLRNTT